MKDKTAIPTAQVAKACRDAFILTACKCNGVQKIALCQLLWYLRGCGVVSRQDVEQNSKPVEPLEGWGSGQ